MTGNTREREQLETAVAQITSGFCLWCPTRRVVVRWHEPAKRWQLVMIHRPKCCATRTLTYRRRADDFLYGLLELYGLLVGHYCEDNLVRHVKVGII